MDLLTYLFTYLLTYLLTFLPEGAKRASQSYREFGNISETLSSSNGRSGTRRNGWGLTTGTRYLNF